MIVDVIIPFVLGVICLAVFLVALRDYKRGKEPKIEDGLGPVVSFGLGLYIYPILAVLLFIATIVNFMEL